MRICYRGNFGPQHSTESHVAWSLEDLGIEVARCQEDTASWADTVAASQGADLFLWTQTYGYAQNWDRGDAFAALADMGARMHTAGFHLDVWWGLQREWMVHRDANEPFFCGLDTLYTADGDHDAEWAEEGINHVWSAPAVFKRECVTGVYRPELASDVTFVGSWRSYAHDEWWPQRKAMLDYVRNRFGGGVRYWPAGQAVRGAALNDTLASCKVTLGDSCMATTSKRYFSDRAFETVGRGGFLISPWVEGLAAMLEDGQHCRYYTPGDHEELGGLIDYYLAHDAEREKIRLAGQEHVRMHHTYENRLASILCREFPVPMG